MLNVIWDISTVLNPRDMPKAMNASIREIPVTISAFSMGMLVMPITTVFGTALMELMEMAAAVPMMVAMFNSKQELPKQDGFRFYFLTDPSTGIDHLSKDAQEVYKTLAEDLPTLYKSVETFQPDEASVAEQASKQGELFGFISTDLEGNAIDSSIFADYDLTAVNFFASYSYPDINELKELESYYQTLQAEYPNVNFVQVIIDTPGNEAEAKILAAYEENGVTFTGIMPDKAMASWIVDNLKGLPTTIFIDKDGRIQGDRIEGKQTADQYLEATKEMLDNL